MVGFLLKKQNKTLFQKIKCVFMKKNYLQIYPIQPKIGNKLINI